MTRQQNIVPPPWFAEAETLKALVLDRLGRMSPEERCRVPGPGEWSAAQMAAHLILAEERLVDDWHTAALASPTVRPGPKGALMVTMAGFAMKNTALRVPTFPTVDPDGREADSGLEPGALAARWASVRQRLVGTIPADATRLWVIHPVFGPLSCRRFGAFLAAHLHHHLRHWPGTAAGK